MKNTRLFSLSKSILLIGFYLLVSLPFIASAAQVTLQWDANDPAPGGYHLYQRAQGGSYNYTTPTWTGTDTNCTIGSLNEGTTYYYVVRAYLGSDESGDSNEVVYTPSVPAPAPSQDSDDDGVSDLLDAFPEDPAEYLDTDADGIGNNGDLDDDGDGMPDSWEGSHGLNSLVDDAEQDLDGDGVSNADEYNAGSDPSQAPGNSAPNQPILSQPDNNASSVGLTPLLIVGNFVDTDNDAHARTCYQISTEADNFTTSLVFERTSAQQLTQLRVDELMLDPDTQYFWRARFIDEHNGISQWSDAHAFTTIDYFVAGDVNSNGVLDNQEVEADVDLDADLTADYIQSGLQAVHTQDNYNPRVAVKCANADANVIAMQALDMQELEAVGSPENLTGVISFKLALSGDTTTATVVVYFSQAAPSDARWYKYDAEEGWSIYPQAVFSSDRMSVTLTLEDGGQGDQDGVQNGLIVDPAGLGYSSQTSDSSGNEPAAASGGSGCFITSAAVMTGGGLNAMAAIFLLMVACALPGIVAKHAPRICK